MVFAQLNLKNIEEREMSKMKFTFRKDIPEGAYRSFQLEIHEIKLNKKIVGYISKGKSISGFGISLAIKQLRTEQTPAAFKWVRLKKRFEKAEEARVFLNDHIDKIIVKYDLHQFED